MECLICQLQAHQFVLELDTSYLVPPTLKGQFPQGILALVWDVAAHMAGI